jgi:Glycosyl transferase family 2
MSSVSVIVPCFSYGHFLEGCVASVLAQEGVEVRVLILDDCSPDDTAAVGQRLANGDDRVEFRRHPSNTGLIATANEGLRWAQSDHVLLLSADDLLVPGSLRRATQIMERHPGVGMVYGRALYACEGQPSPKPAGRWRGAQVWSGGEWIRLRCRSGYNCVSSPTAVVRRSVQEQVGGYDPACYHASDLNMWLRIAAVADIAYIQGIPQAIYRVHPGSMMRSHEGPITDLRERRSGFDSFFATSTQPLGEIDSLRRLAGRALARQALWWASRAIDGGIRDDQPVDRLTEFALESYADTRRLREWRGFRLRRRIGAGRSLIFLPFLATGAAHRVRGYAGSLRLRLKGI